MLLFPFPDDAGQDCNTGIWARHHAFDVVFSNYPERIDLTVDGYIASVSCSDIGRKGSLILNGMVYFVRVADCFNRSAIPSTGYSGDIDYRLWYHSAAPNYPQRATICWSEE